MYKSADRPEAPAVGLCLIFSKDNRKGTHPPDLCLEGGGGEITSKADYVVGDIAGRQPLQCRELVFRDGQRQEYFLYVYKCGDSYTTSFWRQQIVIFLNGLLHRDASGALIRVSTDAGGNLDEARARSAGLMRAAIPHLEQAMLDRRSEP